MPRTPSVSCASINISLAHFNSSKTQAHGALRNECEETNYSTSPTKIISSSVPKDLRASSKLFIVTLSRFLKESTHSLITPLTENITQVTESFHFKRTTNTP